MRRAWSRRSRARGRRRARCRGWGPGAALLPVGACSHFRTCSKCTPRPVRLSSGCVRWRNDDVLPGTPRRDDLARRTPLRRQLRCRAHAPRARSGRGARRLGGRRAPRCDRRVAAQPCSPVGRARRRDDRAVAAARDRLVEIDFGEAEGLTPDEIAKRWPTEWAAFREAPATNPLPGGERGRDGIARALPVLDDLVGEFPDGRVLIVAQRRSSGCSSASSRAWIPTATATCCPCSATAS